MASPTLYDRLILALPGVLVALLLVLCALPISWQYGPLTPHVVWLAALSIGALAPASWPVTLAFLLGLVSDLIFGTPLGAQALLSLFLTLYVQNQARRTSHQLFTLRWAEASLVLMVLYLILWALVGFILPERPPLRGVLIGAVVSMGWFPIFYFGARELVKLLPART
jgi:rod shape-determining protein MreD